MMDGLPLSSLPDGCILNLMTQLPPLARMHLAATCVRYRQIYKYGRLHSLVLGSSSAATPTPHLHSCADGCFPTLAAAVAHSRPGETIVVAPGQHEAADVVVSHPLRIVGDGGSGLALLSCAVPGATAAVLFQASGEVSNLTMQSKKAACILARGGSNLWVKQCSLACDAGGLPHLYSAIVTARPARPCKSSWQRPTMPSALKAGRGSVVVSETYVQGGIRAEGLQFVRCIARGDRAALWFEIRHLAAPMRPNGPQSVRCARTNAAGNAEATAGVVYFTPKRKAAELDDAAAEALLDERAEAWAAQHAQKRITGH